MLVLLLVHARVVPLGRLAGHERQGPPLADAAHEQGHRVLHRLRVGLRPGVVDQPDAGLEQVHPALHRQKRDAEHLVLVLVPAGPDAKDQTASAELVHRRRLARQHGRPVEGHGADHRAELDRLGPLRGQRERRPAVDAVAAVVTHQGDQVLAAPQRRKTERLNVMAEVAPALPGKSLLTLDHDSELRHLCSEIVRSSSVRQLRIRSWGMPALRAIHAAIGT